jgi:hypothetical protein
MAKSKKERPYWWKIFCGTLSETGKIAVFSGAGGAAIGAVLAYAFGFAKREEMPQMFFILAVSAIGGMLVEFIIRFILLPARIHKEQNEKHEALIKQLAERKVLGFEIIHPGKLDLLTGKRTYRIKVKNTHASKVVKNLKVWLCEIKWPQSIDDPLITSGVNWPYQLPKKGEQNNSLPHELSGDSEMEFDLFFIGMTEYHRMMNLAPFLPMANIAASLVGSVYSNTSFDIEILPSDDSKLIFKFKVSGGDGDVDTVTESYILKVPSLLPENRTTNQVETIDSPFQGDVDKINALITNFDKYLPVFEKVENSSPK